MLLCTELRNFCRKIIGYGISRKGSDLTFGTARALLKPLHWLLILFNSGFWLGFILPLLTSEPKLNDTKGQMLKTTWRA